MSDLTRPIIGIENRSAPEVFDIMCDRFRASQAEIERLTEALEMCTRLLPRYRLAGRTTGDDEELAAVLETVTEALGSKE